MMRANARPKALVPPPTHRIHPAPRSLWPRRVCKALSKRWQCSRSSPKFSTIPIRKRASAFDTGESHATRASDLLRFGSRPPHLGSADAREKFSREFAHHESCGSARALIVPISSKPTARGSNCPARSSVPRRPRSPTPPRGAEPATRSEGTSCRSFAGWAKERSDVPTIHQ